MNKNEGYLGNINVKRAGVEQDWTEEQILEYKKCMTNPVHFIENYIKIVTLDTGLQPFKMYQFQRELNPKIKLSLKGVNDMDNKGYLCEIGTIFSVSDDMKIHMYLNNIVGDDSQDEDYRFNQMEDFSHFRLELEYFF